MLSTDGLSAGYDDARLPGLWRELTEKLSNLPGVQGATYSTNGLFSGSESSDEIDVEGFTPSKEEETYSRMDAVGPHYFSTVGIPLLLGRETGLQDSAASPRLCVINEAFANTFFKGRNQIGRHITQKFGNDKLVVEIVGVAGDVRDHRLRGDVPPRMYAPGDQAMGGPNRFANFEVRTAGDPQQMITAVRKTVLAVNHNLPVRNLRPLVESIDFVNAQPKMLARPVTLFRT